MPQIESKFVAKFISELKDQGVDVSEETKEVSKLKSTQNELNIAKIMRLVTDKNNDFLNKPILISSANYVLDGTHRFAAAWIKDEQHLMKVLRIGLKIEKLFEKAREFSNTKFKKISETINEI